MSLFRRTSLIFITLLALLSQSVAGVMMNCQSSEDLHSLTSSQTNDVLVISTQHSHHMLGGDAANQVVSDDANPSSTMDCCNDDCLCPVSGCSSIALFSEPSLEAVELQITAVPSLIGQSPIHQTETLYRPPILG